MKQICSFLTVFLLAAFSWGTASAAAVLPTPSKADGSADVWYHIRLTVRTWGIWGNTGVQQVEAGLEKGGYYFDQGWGEPLINVEDTLNVPGTRWKLVETGKTDEYQLISGLGNTLDCDPEPNRIYTTTPTGQLVTIKNPNGNFLGLTLSGARRNGGVDKGGGSLFFDQYGPDAVGGAIAFVPAEPLTGTYLSRPGDFDLGDVPVNLVRKKTLTVTGINLSGKLNYSIVPANAGFSVPSETTANTNGGTVEITFTPTERKAYTAELTISIGNLSVTTTLTGNADFDFPLQISEDGGDEHWYYIQFERQIENNKVLQANDMSKPITQELILGNTNKQLWKIVGNWDGYHIVNKVEGELAYESGNNRYKMDDFEGNAFGFNRFKDTEDWQLRNMDVGHSDNPDRRYLNDLDADGDSVSNYSVNDDGNRLVFIPATTHKLVVGLESVDFGTAPAGTGATIKKTVPVGGLNLTGTISATIEGVGAAAFTLTSSTLQAEGGEFEITFSPLTIDNYKAQLILRADGVEEVTVELTARGGVFPFTVSNGSNEYWYYIQFVRRTTKALTSHGIGQEVLQDDWVASQEIDENQLWKITGSWDNYKFVSKKGGELVCTINKFDDDGDPEYNMYTLAAANGDRHIAVEKTTGTNTGWGFQNAKAKEAKHTVYMNDNGGTKVGLYGYLDEGGPFNFISVAETAILPSTSLLAYGDVTTGFKREKTLTVTGTKTTAPISYVLAGSGKDAFNVSTTTEGATNTSLPAAGGALKITFDPAALGDYIATLTLQSTNALDVVIILTGKCVSFPEDFPVKISDATSTTWYTVYFNRSYTSGNSWKVWTAGLSGETVKQTAYIGRENPDLTLEEQLWKFVLAPSRTGYLAVSYSGLEVAAGTDYTLGEQGEGAPLVFYKNPDRKAWVLINPAANNGGGKALNDKDQKTICEWSDTGNDDGCPMGFLETALPDPVRIQISTLLVEFPNKIEAGAPALYSSDVEVKGFELTGDINLALSGDGASAYTIVHAADSTEVGSTLPAAGGTLKIKFAPTAAQACNATLTFTSGNVTAKTIALAGAGLKLPAKASTAAEPIWYYISFARQSAKVLTADGDTLRQEAKAEVEADTQLWRIEGNAADGYQLINRAERRVAYDSTSTVKTYLIQQAEGDRFSFVSGAGDNAAKVQLYNRTNTANGSYLNDKSGLYATNYNINDGGNWLTFTPQIPDGIIQIDPETNDPVVSSAYYNLQGMRIQQPVRGNFYIRIDTLASKKTRATKIFLVK
jgi:hypothetical protein